MNKSKNRHKYKSYVFQMRDADEEIIKKFSELLGLSYAGFIRFAIYNVKNYFTIDVVLNQIYEEILLQRENKDVF